MTISARDWKNYITRLHHLSEEAGRKMREWVRVNGYDDRDALINYAYAIATKYGEGSAALSCQMYDAIAELEGAKVAAAIPANTATYAETAKTINGVMFQSPEGKLLDSAVGRLVKQASADTMIKNVKRDGAEWAWVPVGDTCAFCITLASRGWQPASSDQIKGSHASHIHANCDCTFAIRFNSRTQVGGYDPDKYKKIYDDASTETAGKKVIYRDPNTGKLRTRTESTSTAKINAIRRAQYAEKNGE